MKLAIVGSRNFSDLGQVSDYVLSLPRSILIVSGGARGVDRYAEQAAIQRRISRLIYEPQCEDGDPAYVQALHDRTARIVRVSDKVVAFHDGNSNGTGNAIKLALKLGKELEIRKPR